jgi:hypothetical protein
MKKVKKFHLLNSNNRHHLFSTNKATPTNPTRSNGFSVRTFSAEPAARNDNPKGKAELKDILENEELPEGR